MIIYSKFSRFKARINNSPGVTLLIITTALFFMSAEINAQSPDKELEKKGASISMDLRSQSVADILPGDSLEIIKTKMNKENVEAFTYEAEGDTYTGYKLTFANGETVDLYLSHFEINTENIRTEEGLGVGSTWGEFKNAYKDGKLDWASDAYAAWSETYKFRLYFEGISKPKLEDRVTSIHINRSIIRW